MNPPVFLAANALIAHLFRFAMNGFVSSWPVFTHVPKSRKKAWVLGLITVCLLQLPLSMKATCTNYLDFTIGTTSGLSSTFLKTIAYSSAYSGRQTNGKLRFTKSQGESSAGITAQSRFKLTGDFSLIVEAFWETGNNSIAGIWARGSNASVGVYFTSPSQVYFNGCQPGCSGAAESSPYKELRIDKTGSTVTAYIHDPNFLIPHWKDVGTRTIFGEVTIELSMFQQQSGLPSSQSPASCSFDNFSLITDTCPLVDTTSNAPPLQIFAATQICFLSEFSQIYQIQYSDELDPPNWTPLIDNIPGNGDSICHFQPARNPPKRYYRVVTVAQ